MYRHNQELEQEQFRLEQEAEGLAQRLDAVLQANFAGSNFDADTPIDKTLAFLQSIVKVSMYLESTQLWLLHCHIVVHSLSAHFLMSMPIVKCQL